MRSFSRADPMIILPLRDGDEVVIFDLALIDEAT
jgi:hypothetical protein